MPLASRKPGGGPTGRAEGAARAARPAKAKAATRATAATRRPARLTLAGGRFLGRLSLDDGPAREIDAPLRIDLRNHHHHLIPDIHYILRPIDAMLGQLGDMDQSLLAGQDLGEGTEVDQPRDAPQVDLADLHLLGHGANDLGGALGTVAERRGDAHQAGIVDLDGAAGLLLDLADCLAARADHRSDLLLGDAH